MNETGTGPGPPVQRWLILTSSTGSGHDMRAYALRDWAHQLYGERVHVEVWHVLEETSSVGAVGVQIYNRIQRHWPGLHQVFWHVAEGWSLINSPLVQRAGGSLHRRLREYRPHLVCSVHDSLNAGYLGAARRVLGREAVRCATYCGEWSPGYGFSRHWVDPEVDLFISRTSAVAAYAHQRGVAPERTRVFRNLLRPDDFDGDPEELLPSASQRRAMGLDPDAFVLLLATGALGADRHDRMLEALLPLAGRVQAIALCGRNGQARHRVKAWAARHPSLKVRVQGFTAEMSALFRVADAILTRGGSNTMAECVHFRKPVLFHAEGGMMPQEYCTRRFLESTGIGRVVRRPRDLEPILSEWTGENGALAAIQERFIALKDGSHPRELLGALHSLAAEVA